MSKDSRTDHFFIYPKDKAGKFTGHTVCVLQREGRMFEGTALCHGDDQFTKKTGRALALQRALEAAAKSLANTAKAEAPKKSKKAKVSHYTSKAIGFGDEDLSIYKVKRKIESTPSGFGTTQKLELSSSKLDKSWTEKAFSEDPRVVLDEDGDGVLVSFNDNTDGQYLDYSKLHDLYMILHLFYSKKPYKGYEFKRVK